MKNLHTEDEPGESFLVNTWQNFSVTK